MLFKGTTEIFTPPIRTRRITLSASIWLERAILMTLRSQYAPLSQIKFHRTPAQKASLVGGQRAGMMQQTRRGHCRRKSTILERSPMDRLRKSRAFALWILIVANVPGVFLFLYFASRVWAPPGQEEAYRDFAVALSWALSAFPFLAICTLINFILSRSVLIHFFYYKDWRLILTWLTIVVVWSCAYAYDYGRRFAVSQISNEAPGAR
jgi:hypothetical protein